MKKILAIVLAVCLTLSLSVAVFANGSIVLPPSSGVGSSDPTISANTYSAVDASGALLSVKAVKETAGAVYDEIAAYGVVALFNLDIYSNVTGSVTFDLYAPGATKDSVVIVRDAWEAGLATFTVNGDRVKITIDADLVKTYHYVAIVNNFDGIDVNVPQQSTDNVDDEPGDDITVTDTTPKDENPKTGVALAVVPMMVAAAAVVASKRR